MMMKHTNSLYLHLLLVCLGLLMGISTTFGATYDIFKPTETVGVCPADLPYYWHNKAYNKDGIYHDTIVLAGKHPAHVITRSGQHPVIDPGLTDLILQDHCFFNTQLTAHIRDQLKQEAGLSRTEKPADDQKLHSVYP